MQILETICKESKKLVVCKNEKKKIVCWNIAELNQMTFTDPVVQNLTKLLDNVTLNFFLEIC